MIFNLFPDTTEHAMLEPDRNAEALASNLAEQAAKGLRFTPHEIDNTAEGFRQRRMFAASNAIHGTFDLSWAYVVKRLLGRV